MAYSTQADLEKRISEIELFQLTSDDTDAEEADGDVIAEAIADADEEINSFVGVRYPVPFTTVPGRLKTISADIALYNLFSRRGDVVPEIRTERYKSAIRFLQDVGKGTATLGALDPGGNPPDTDGVAYETSDQVMTDLKLGGF